MNIYSINPFLKKKKKNPREINSFTNLSSRRRISFFDIKMFSSKKIFQKFIIIQKFRRSFVSFPNTSVIRSRNLLRAREFLARNSGPRKSFVFLCRPSSCPWNYVSLPRKRRDAIPVRFSGYRVSFIVKPTSKPGDPCHFPFASIHRERGYL